MKEQKPKQFLVFKIIGFVGLAVLVTAIVLAVTGFNDFESPNFMIGTMLAPFGLFVTVAGIAIGFKAEIAKMSAKSKRYVQQEIKEDLTEIATTSAEISAPAIEKTAEAIASGLAADKVACKHCGEMIEAGSQFCNHCGKKQDERST